MSFDDVAIHVNNLGKCYQIYNAPRDRLKQFFAPRLQRLAGKLPKQYFQEFWALNDVSFEVKKGECLGVIGRNGSGKSTLLQIIAGTLSPNNGIVRVNGKVAALLELGSGFNPEFTGRENVYMNGAIMGLSKVEMDKRFDEIVAFADIGDFIDQPVKIYSSGMMLRLAFAVVVNVDADILIIDEALAVGDAFFVQKCMRFLRKFMETNTLLLVSHDTGAIINLCDRAILLEEGKVKLSGTPKEASEQYLSDLYESMQGKSEVKRTEKHILPETEYEDYHDMRQEFINNSNLRNDIEIFKFNPDSDGFGTGGATIESVVLYDPNDSPLLWVVGGEMVKLKIKCKANKDIFNPAVGFYVKDRHGQPLFAETTNITYLNNPLSIANGDVYVAEFFFRMPFLPIGEYSIMAATAEGDNTNHVQLHWLHDALFFKSHSTCCLSGYMELPIKQITIEVNK